MPGIQVNEPLNPSRWTRPQQQQVYDALVQLLDISTGGKPPSEMTDAELAESIDAHVEEMKRRGNSESGELVTWQDHSVFVT